MGQTVNLLTSSSVVRIHLLPRKFLSGSSSVDRALAFQAKGREFEPRLPLNVQMRVMQSNIDVRCSHIVRSRF